MMGTIYAEAHGVFAWLGPGSKAIDRLLEYSYDGEGFDSVGLIAGLPINDDDLQGLREMVQRPYWKRIWTVQELAKAKKATLMCGDKSMEIDGIKRLVGRDQEADKVFFERNFEYDLVYSKEISSPWTLRDLAQWRSISYCYWHYILNSEENHSQSLKNLQYSFGDMECQDKHDCVYALLGLVTWPNADRWQQHLKVNYNDPLPKLFTKTLSYFESTGGYDTSYVLDLANFLELGMHASEIDRDTLITSSQPLVGTVGQNLRRMNCEGTKLADQVPWEELDNIEEWACTRSLLHCTVDTAERKDIEWPGTAIFDSDLVLPAQKLYILNVDLASTKFKFRPAECDGLVLAAHVDDCGTCSVAVGVHIGGSRGTLHSFDVKNRSNDGQHLLLVRWRQIVEEHLRTAHFDISRDKKTLSITLTMGVYISLSKALLEAADEWEE
jgi:hypothetical protein